LSDPRQRPGAARPSGPSRTTVIGLVVFLVLPVVLVLPAIVARPGPAPRPTTPARIDADVAVYGGTASGVVAAISAARVGADVVLIERSPWLGGMVTSGLGATDVRSRTLVGGITREFYRRVGEVYGITRLGQDVAWYHEPHVAGEVFDAMLAEAGVQVLRSAPLDRASIPEMDGPTITAIRLTTGTMVHADTFVDASYEGDLMAAAGVPYFVGREATSTYGEPLAGVTDPPPASTAIDRVYGRRYSDGRPLPGVAEADGLAVGAADGLVQPYNFRLCVTDVAANRTPFREPAGYDRVQYSLLERALETWIAAGAEIELEWLVTIVPLPNGKGDLNNAGLYSTDLLGGISAGWADATDPEREQLWEVHRRYQAGLLYFLANDPAVPEAIRAELGAWGLCRDEFSSTSGWPPQLYVRESRRMVGDVVLTQADVQDDLHKPDSVGIGTYRIDGHYVRRVLDPDGFVRGEGDINGPVAPYEIPYSILVPPARATDNLLVTSAVSASHVAFASLRMEVNFMAMGEAGGAAAAISALGGIDVADVPYEVLAAELETRNPVLER
jgi:hypothetical protein